MKNNQRDPQQRLVFGLLIMAVGVLALLDNLRIFEGVRLISFWPAVFIVGGILKMSQSQARSGYVIGAIFIAVGSIMTLNNLGVISVRIRDFWPVILIAVGFLVIFKDKAKQTMNDIAVTKINDNKEGKIDIVAIMSGSQGNIANANFIGGDITAVMGGVELDLRNASIETEAVINVFAFWGGISLKVPNDWSVVNSANAVLGGIDDSTVPNMSANKRLIITGTAVMGGVEIKN